MDDQPDTLYKYRSLGASENWTQAIVEQHQIWFSKPSEFNDPFDCNLYVPYRLQRGQLGERLLNHFWPDDSDSPAKPTKILKAAGRGARVDPDELKKARKTVGRRLLSGIIRKAGLRVSASGPDGTIDVNEHVDQNRHERLKTVVDALDSSIGVLSLSASKKNILLWSHYAENHHGVCLEFDREKLGAKFPRLQDVRYGPMPELSARFPAMVEKLWSLAPNTPHRLIVAAANVLAAGPPGENLDADFEEAMDSELRYLVDWFYTKYDDWDYEQEWRALAPRNGLVEFPPEALTGIIIGCAADSDTVDKTRSWVANGKSPVTISVAQKVDGKFELKILPVDQV